MVLTVVHARGPSADRKCDVVFPFTQREAMTHLFYESVQTFSLVNLIFMHQTARPLPLDTDDCASLTFDCRCCFCSLFMIHSFCIFKKKNITVKWQLCALMPVISGIKTSFFLVIKWDYFHCQSVTYCWVPATGSVPCVTSLISVSFIIVFIFIYTLPCVVLRRWLFVLFYSAPSISYVSFRGNSKQY